MPIESDNEMSAALQGLLDLVTSDRDTLDDLGLDEAEDLAQLSVRDFGDDVLTDNEGFTVRLTSGAEFQVTIVRSR